MAEIIDTLLAPRVGSFVVNKAVASVAVTFVSLATPVPFASAAGKSRFVKGDSFTLLSGAYNCDLLAPESLPATGPTSLPAFGIAPERKSDSFLGRFLTIPDLIFTPFLNYELSIGIYENVVVNAPLYTSATGFRICALPDNTGLKIDMAPIPAGHDGQTAYVHLFIKVLHNLSLVTW